MSENASAEPGPLVPGERRRSLLARTLLRYCPHVCGWFSLLVSAAALAGWSLGVSRLASIGLGLPPMLAGSALMTGLAGASLPLLAKVSPSRTRLIAGRLLASGAGLIAVLTLAAHFLGVDLRIAQLIVSADSRAIEVSIQGRPLPRTAVTVLLLAAALLALERRTAAGRRPAEILALVSGVVPLLTLVGHLFELAALKGPLSLLSYEGMSIATAAALLAVSAGILAARAEEGALSILIADDSAGIAARKLVAWLSLLVPLIGAIALGARMGLYEWSLASAGIVLAGLVGGGFFFFRVSRRLRLLDAKRSQYEESLRAAGDTERHLRAELEGVGRASTAVAEALADLPSLALSQVLSMVALQAQALASADYVALGIVSHPGEPFHPWVFVGVPEDVARAIGRHPRPVGTLGIVAQEGQVIRTGDVRLHPSFRGWPASHHDMASLLGVPIFHRGRAVGNLYLGRRPGAAAFDEREERLIRMLAARVGAAIETATHHVAHNLQRGWLQNTIDQMPDGVFLYDERGRLKAVNQAGLALSCEEPGRLDPLGNATFLDLREPRGDATPSEEGPIARALRSSRSIVREEWLLRRRSGDIVPVAISTAPMRDPDGASTGMMVIVREIPGLRETERLREEWAAMVVHDLRQPLGIVTLSIDSLLKALAGVLTDKQRGVLERIKLASGRMNRMIEDLLDVSRIEASRLELRRRQVDLDALIGAAIDGMRDVVLAGHDLQVQVQPGQVIWVDPDRIQQVLGNLLSNAAKYGQKGAEIRIEAFTREDEVEVVVINRGPGISPEQLSLLFSRFGRGQGARESGTPGLGLGLYIARGLVEAHGGRLWAESVPGETTRFHFTLPRAPPVPAVRGEDTAPSLH